MRRFLAAIFIGLFSGFILFHGGISLVSDARAQQRDWIDVHFHLIANKGDLKTSRFCRRTVGADGVNRNVVVAIIRGR